MPPIRRVAFVTNTAKPGAPELTRDLRALADAAGVEVRATEMFPIGPEWLAGCDGCCVIGGDGTLLGVAVAAARQGVPVIGVNRGNLGFLTTFSAEEARVHFREILRGHYHRADRTMLECTVGAEPAELVLNDVVLKEEMATRLIHLEVFADEEFITEYACDGLIFSTPTGSTAYNLSAGGPLIQPDAEVIAMTPICPHTLSNRSIIFRPDLQLRVINRTSRSRLLVTLDGQRHVVVDGTVPVRIARAALRLPLLQRADYSHFAVVRTKLGWSGGFSG